SRTHPLLPSSISAGDRSRVVDDRGVRAENPALANPCLGLEVDFLPVRQITIRSPLEAGNIRFDALVAFALLVRFERAGKDVDDLAAGVDLLLAFRRQADATLMQDRTSANSKESSCNARPDHAFGSFSSDGHDPNALTAGGQDRSSRRLTSM